MTSETGRTGRRGTGLAPLVAATYVCAALVGAPVLSLAFTALSGESAILLHVARNILPRAPADTALLLGGVALVTSILGIGTAWLVTAYRFPGRSLIGPALMLPLSVPTYIVAYVYVELFDSLGPVQSAWRELWGFSSRADYAFPEIRSLPGAIFVMSFVLYPYLYMTARALFAMQSASLLEVGRTLGAGPFALLQHVALPLARPAIALGLSLILLETLNDIGASEYLGVQTLSVSIYTTWLNRGSLPGAAQIACAMVIVVILILALERCARGDRRFSASLKRPRPVAAVLLRGTQGWLVALACCLPVVLGFLLPAGFLAKEALTRLLREGFDPALSGQLQATLILAAMATGLVTLLGVMIAASARLIPAITMLARIAGLGYAIPGTVLAIGLLWPVSRFDNHLAELIKTLTGVSPGLILTGTGAAIVLAYVVRFLGIAIGGVESGYTRISHRIDDAARALGRHPRAVFVQIHLPLLRPSIVSAALLVFVDCCKELPATLLLRPLNLETLATSVYADAARGQFEDGSLAALLIVAVGLIPVILAARAQTERPDIPVPGTKIGVPVPLAS